MLGRESRSQPFVCLFIQNGCEGRSKDKERQKPIKPGEGRGQTTFVVWSIWFLVRVVEKGAFAREEKFQFGKKCKAESWNDMEIIPPPREFFGAFVFFFFQNHCNCPTVGAEGRGFIQRPHSGAEISVQMPDPGTTLKLHFLSSVFEA